MSLLAGTAERLARIAPIGDAVLAPGKSGFARLHLVRADGAPAGRPLRAARLRAHRDRRDARRRHRARRRRRRTAAAAIRSSCASSRSSRAATRRPTCACACAARVSRAPRAPRSRARRAGSPARSRPRSRARSARGALATAGERVLDASALARLEHELLAALDAYHAAEPLRPGMPAGALRGALPENVPPEVAELALERLARAGAIALEADHVRLAKHQPTLDPAAQRGLRPRSRRCSRQPGSRRPRCATWPRSVGLAEAAARDLLAHLEREHRLVRARPDLWFDARASTRCAQRVLDHFASRDELDTPAYKALIGTSRRTAVPLMELFDAERLTVRRGEAAIARGSAEIVVASDRTPNCAGRVDTAVLLCWASCPRSCFNPKYVPAEETAIAARCGLPMQRVYIVDVAYL